MHKKMSSSRNCLSSHTQTSTPSRSVYAQVDIITRRALQERKSIKSVSQKGARTSKHHHLQGSAFQNQKSFAGFEVCAGSKICSQTLWIVQLYDQSQADCAQSCQCSAFHRRYATKAHPAPHSDRDLCARSTPFRRLDPFRRSISPWHSDPF